MNKELAYWLTLAHDLPTWGFTNRDGWKNEDKMNLIIRFFHENKLSIEEFFSLSEKEWRESYQLSEKHISDLLLAKEKVPNNAFLAESILNNGIEIIPVTSPDYSKLLKENMKRSIPVLLYIKGDKQLLKGDSVAIVGSRNASELALKFTDNIAKKASCRDTIYGVSTIVSGFAKGVDKQALDSALKYKGKSIIVLPQGIMTFESGFKTYYRQILDGDVLVLSIFAPKGGWNVDLAMARNPIIYGLAKEIYVAESKSSKNKQGEVTKGGTYAGAKDGLRKGRTVYVRLPEKGEDNDNLDLIKEGGIPVDINGERVEYSVTGYSQPSLF
jgi:predicted Rossmann fold nucleotide-binding protein DprA/Smf involved in DNA uptake